MSVLLSLETSTDVCSVAVHDAGKLLAIMEVHKGQAHASKLAPLIKEVVSMADMAMNDLNGIAVSAGPGSYTGLRIGTSTAKGLCFALAIPLIAVGTLDIMAHQMRGLVMEDSWFCPMIDARRMEVYCALYDRSARLTEVEAKVVDEHSFQDSLDQRRVVFGGNGSDKCRSVLLQQAAVFVPGVFPSARELGALATEKLGQGLIEDLTRFEPFYLKDFKAKLPTNIIAAAVNKPA